MSVIGITGGIGSGKSMVIKYLQENYGMHVIKADDVSNSFIEKNGLCYDRIVSLLGADILDVEQNIDHKKMASVIFTDESLLKQVNAILHPAVKTAIRREIQETEKAGSRNIVIEAALMIEERYDLLVDETWYIYASESTRRKRLSRDRGYSDQKIDAIMAKQPSEEMYENFCDKKIVNENDFSETINQIDSILGCHHETM